MEKRDFSRVLRIQELFNSVGTSMLKMYWSKRSNDFSRKCKMMFPDYKFCTGMYTFTVYYAIGAVRLNYDSKGTPLSCNISSTTTEKDIKAILQVPEKEYCKLLRAILYCMK